MNCTLAFLKFSRLNILALLLSVFWSTIGHAGVDQGNPKAIFHSDEFSYEFSYDSKFYSVDQSKSDFVKLHNTKSDVVFSVRSITTSINNPSQISNIVDTSNCTETTFNSLDGYKCQDRYLLLAPKKTLFEINLSNDPHIQSVIESFVTTVRYPSEMELSSSGQYLVIKGQSLDLKQYVIEVKDRFSFTQYRLTSDTYSNNGTLKFLSENKILISNFNGKEFEIFDVSTQKEVCSKSGNTKAQAVASADGSLIGVISKEAIAVYKASDCSLVKSIPWDIDLNNRGVNFNPIAIDTKNKKFIFWAGIWNDIQANFLYSFSYENGNLSSLKNVVDTDINDFQRVVNRPGTSEVWFFSMRSYEHRQLLQVIDYETGKTKTMTNDIISSQYYSSFDLKFSPDGNKFLLAVGWHLGVYNSTGFQEIKVVPYIGCVVSNSQSCSLWDSTTAVFGPAKDEITFAGDRGIRLLKF